jgi:hypothetical protein
VGRSGVSIRGLGCEFPRVLLEFSGGGARFFSSPTLDVQDHLSRADLGQSLMASPMTIDYLYQQTIIYGLDKEFIVEMQRLSRCAMLPPDSK